MRIVGIDPGKTGAIVLINTEDWSLQIADMPREPGSIGKETVSPTGVVILINRYNPDYTFIESVWSSPQQGVTSAFNFGRSLGIVLGAAASRSALTLVRPTVWKSATNTPRDKNQARARAQALFPSAYHRLHRVKDDGRAEAALLAFYGLLSLKLTPPRPLTLIEDIDA